MQLGHGGLYLSACHKHQMGGIAIILLSTNKYAQQLKLTTSLCARMKWFWGCSACSDRSLPSLSAELFTWCWGMGAWRFGPAPVKLARECRSDAAWHSKVDNAAMACLSEALDHSVVRMWRGVAGASRAAGAPMPITK
jgi:hypothetical protein